MVIQWATTPKTFPTWANLDLQTMLLTLLLIKGKHCKLTCFNAAYCQESYICQGGYKCEFECTWEKTPQKIQGSFTSVIFAVFLGAIFSF
jgi:hypothetical protein